MGIILKARKVLKKTLLYQLYNSLVFPYLIYCSEVWSTASNIHLQPLINLQNKIIAIINLSPYNSPIKLIFQELLNILPFPKNVFHRIGHQMFKYEFGIMPIALQNIFCTNCSVHFYTRN